MVFRDSHGRDFPRSTRPVKDHFTSLKTDLIFLQMRDFRRNISINLYSLQVENCDSSSRLVVDEDENGKFRLKRVILQRHS